MVIGTTGLSEANLREIEQLCQANGVGVIVSPDFSIGSALLIHLSRLAARFFDHAEIVEMHNDEKARAPSATSMATARAMSETHGGPFVYPGVQQNMLSNTRGGEMDGIAIHSLRLPGFVAGQEVILGAAGETLSLRHDVAGLECYIPGIMLAIKGVVRRKGLTLGLDSLLELI